MKKKECEVDVYVVRRGQVYKAVPCGDCPDPKSRCSFLKHDDKSDRKEVCVKSCYVPDWLVDVFQNHMSYGFVRVRGIQRSRPKSAKIRKRKDHEG